MERVDNEGGGFGVRRSSPVEEENAQGVVRKEFVMSCVAGRELQDKSSSHPKSQGPHVSPPSP